MKTTNSRSSSRTRSSSKQQQQSQKQKAPPTTTPVRLTKAGKPDPRARKKKGRHRQPWEYAGDGRKGATSSNKLLPHWKDTNLWCPHCERTFKYRDMWAGLGRKGLTVWEAAELLVASWRTVVAAAKTHGMELALKGTQPRNALEEIALRGGFRSGRAMLYQYIVKENHPYGKVARFLDMPVEDVKAACRYVFLGDEAEAAEEEE